MGWSRFKSGLTKTFTTTSPKLVRPLTVFRNRAELRLLSLVTIQLGAMNTSSHIVHPRVQRHTNRRLQLSRKG